MENKKYAILGQKQTMTRANLNKRTTQEMKEHTVEGSLHVKQSFEEMENINTLNNQSLTLYIYCLQCDNLWMKILSPYFYMR